MDVECVFCGIINKKIPAKIEYEDDLVVAFADIHPKARFHMLIVPKKHTLDVIAADESYLKSVAEVIKKFKVNDYKIEINGGNKQEIKHLHFHLMSERGSEI